MSDETPAKPGKKIDNTQFRQELFGEASVSAEGQPDGPIRDEHGERAASDARSASTARPSAGYRNPPAETRFAKGKSGNPGGRPKGSGKAKVAQPAQPSSVDEIRRRLAATPVRVREGEDTRELHIIEALSKNLEKLAFAGGVQATRAALDRHEDTLRRLDAEHQENVAWVADYCAKYPERAAAYEKAGEAVPDWIARPEDIHLSREKGLRIIGPYTPETLESHLLLKRWRDAMHVKMIYDQMIFFRHPGIRITMTMAEFIVHGLDHLMPKRWKLASQEMRDREALLIWISRPRLIQKLEEVFEPLGLKAPIREPMPPIPDKMLRALKINPKQMKERFVKRG